MLGCTCAETLDVYCRATIDEDTKCNREREKRIGITRVEHISVQEETLQPSCRNQDTPANIESWM